MTSLSSDDLTEMECVGGFEAAHSVRYNSAIGKLHLAARYVEFVK